MLTHRILSFGVTSVVCALLMLSLTGVAWAACCTCQNQSCDDTNNCCGCDPDGATCTNCDLDDEVCDVSGCCDGNQTKCAVKCKKDK